MAAQNQKNPDQKDRGQKNPFLSGFLLGLFAGLGLAVAVALLITRSNPFVDNSTQNNAQTTGKNEIPVDAPRYEFNPSPADEQTTPAMPERIGYFLQAGAFTKAADADQMKARLALLGFEAQVATASGETPLSKVQIGPYKALDELNTARARLTQNGIDTILIKIPPQTQEKP